MREVSFSLNSLRPDLQEDLDLVPGTFDRRIGHLLALADRLPRRGVLPVLNVVVTPRNVGELGDLLDLAARIGFFVSLIPVHLAAEGERTHRAYGCDADLRFAAEERPEVRAAYREVIQRKARGAPVLNSTAFLERSADYLARGRTPWPCRAGRLYLSVSPDGRIGACHAFEGTGDLPFREFAKRWRASGFRRELARAHEHCEGCFRPCWAEVSFLMTDPRSLIEMAAIQTRSWTHARTIDRDGARALLGQRGAAAR
jgi:MoaA/NifB/PqqE/SkfB family radical SAM enzyme